VAIVPGVHGTSNINTDLLKRDVLEPIMLKDPERKVLTILLTKLGQSKSIATKVEHFERDWKARQFQLGAAFTYASDTTITVPTGYWQQLVAGQVLKHQKTGAQYIVDATPTTTTVTLTGAAGSTVWGETAGANMAQNDYLRILGTATEEGSASPAARSQKVETEFNYTTILKEPYGVTRTDNAVGQYGKPQGDYNSEKLIHLDEYYIKKELAILFGERKRDTSGTHPRQMLRGTYKWANDGGNIKTYTSGSLTDANVIDFVKLCAQESGKPAILLASLGLYAELAGLAIAKTELDPDKTKQYGFAINKINVGMRPVYTTIHRAIEGDLDGYGILVTLENLKLRPLVPLLPYDDTGTPNVASKEGYWEEEFSMTLKHAASHGILKPA